MLQTRYITLDDFREYFNIDLTAEMEGEGDALAFLKRIEDRMESYIQTHFFKIIDEEYVRFSEFQKKHYKLVLLEQCIYIFRNGDISVDSGYDPDIGRKANRAEIVQLSIAPNAKEHLVVCGLWNRHIGPTRGFWGLW
jgi:hypothetical protein